MSNNNQLTELNSLATFINPENCFKLSQYIWWSNHSFLESFSIEKDLEFDDMGSYQDVYYIVSIKIKDTEGLINFLLEGKHFNCIKELLELDSDIRFIPKRLQDRQFLDSLYSKAKLIKGNEKDYDLIELLESSEILKFYIFYQNVYKNITKNPDLEVIQDWVDNLSNTIKTFVFNYGK